MMASLVVSAALVEQVRCQNIPSLDQEEALVAYRVLEACLNNTKLYIREIQHATNVGVLSSTSVQSRNV